MKGYKVFNSDWTCRDFQYEVGKTYEMQESPNCCERGFHFCKKLIDCFNYYEFDPNNKVAEVEAIGEINSTENKSCTNKIKIIREMSWIEVLEKVNMGKRNTGYCNSGNHNSGDYNSGSYNSGSYNSGNFNSGRCNSGDYNSGNFNSGDFNSGHFNSGSYNSGDSNIGDYNSGRCNCGDYNSGNFTNGCFNTIDQKMYMFNKPSDMFYFDWVQSPARKILQGMPQNSLKWVCDNENTDEEKEQYSNIKTTGGYLKEMKISSKERQEWWNTLLEHEKNEIKNIPNFDPKIFKGITGIDVFLTEENDDV